MKKAQQAMEFLITYGWALLIVLIVIAALAYFGVLNPERLLPQSCILMPGLSCTDFKVNAEGIAITVLNGYGKNFQTFGIAVQNDGGDCDDVALVPIEGGNDLKDGETKTYVAECAVTDTRFKADLVINYLISGELAHSKIGSIAAMVEGEAVFDGGGEEGGAADEGICQNADTAGLCPGLDIVFGSGYQSACCSSYTLCC